MSSRDYVKPGEYIVPIAAIEPAAEPADRFMTTAAALIFAVGNVSACLAGWFADQSVHEWIPRALNISILYIVFPLIVGYWLGGIGFLNALDLKMKRYMQQGGSEGRR